MGIATQHLSPDTTVSLGISWGSGTASDPYIISDWNVNASSANGIQILNTTAHFIIRDCYIHDGGSNYFGIILINSMNGTLRNNDCLGNYGGMGLSLSNSTTLINNNCSDNIYGMVMVSSSNNTLIDNKCLNNGNASVEWVLRL